MPGPTGTVPGAATLWELVRRRVALTPEAAMAVDERARSITFARYAEEAEVCAAGLGAMGVGVGTVVSWQLPTWIESMVLCGALARLGAVQVPIIPNYRAREVGFILRQSAASLFVVPSVWSGFDFEAMAAGVKPGGTSVLVIDPGARRLPAGDPAVLAPWEEACGPDTLDDVRWLFYTSGTTGEPKGARHSAATAYAGAFGMLTMLGLKSSDRESEVFPFAHIGGLLWVIAGLVAGSTHLLAERFDPATTIRMLAANEVTLAGSGTPFNLAYLAAQRELAKTRPGERLFPHIRAFMSGAAPKPPHLHATMRDELGGTGICSSFGMTEAPAVTACTTGDPDDKRATTEGRAVNGVTIEIVGADGATLTPGVVGEIVLRGPQVCHGYVDPTLDVAFDEHGRLHTGDLGLLDEDGYLTVTGRLKDLIIRKGENISAKEIEDLLYDHPAVEDVAVIGLPDPGSGELACAVVVAKAGRPVLSFDEMVAYLKGCELMVQKIPERLEIVDTLPRNPAGKVLKQELQRRFGGA